MKSTPAPSVFASVLTSCVFDCVFLYAVQCHVYNIVHSEPQDSMSGKTGAIHKTAVKNKTSKTQNKKTNTLKTRTVSMCKNKRAVDSTANAPECSCSDDSKVSIAEGGDGDCPMAVTDVVTACVANLEADDNMNSHDVVAGDEAADTKAAAVAATIKYDDMYCEGGVRVDTFDQETEAVVGANMIATDDVGQAVAKAALKEAVVSTKEAANATPQEGMVDDMYSEGGVRVDSFDQETEAIVGANMIATDDKGEAVAKAALKDAVVSTKEVTNATPQEGMVGTSEGEANVKEVVVSPNVKAAVIETNEVDVSAKEVVVTDNEPNNVTTTTKELLVV